jgi:hypothetical protein
VPDALCLTEGFPNGMCSAPCPLYCPDRAEPGDTATFCIDGTPYGQDEGICAPQCDEDVFPGTGCPAGYACVERNRHADPATVKLVCLPTPPTGPCPGAKDALIPLDYPDKGAVWVPAEAQCGGAFDLVVMLHGINPDSTPAPSLGGGRRLEVLVRSLIDAGLVRPLLLAEPVHFEGSSSALYGAGFEPTVHLDKVLAALAPYGAALASLSYTGHSGAGCDADNGLYKILAQRAKLIPAYAPTMPLWGLEDVCYESAYHWEAPLAALSNTSTAIVNMYTVQGDPDAFEAGLLPGAVPMSCSPTLYDSCIRAPARPWCSLRTRAAAGIVHNNNPYFFVREVFPSAFSTAAGVLPCGN